MSKGRKSGRQSMHSTRRTAVAVATAALWAQAAWGQPLVGSPQNPSGNPFLTSGSGARSALGLSGAQSAPRQFAPPTPTEGLGPIGSRRLGTAVPGGQTARMDAYRYRATGGVERAGLVIRGTQLSGARALQMLSQPIAAQRPMDADLLLMNVKQTRFNVGQSTLQRTYNESNPLDRYGRAFARAPLRMAPTLPAPPAINRDLEARETDKNPVGAAAVPYELRRPQVERDVNFFMGRAIDSFFAKDRRRSDALFNRVRSADLDFSAVRLMKPEDPLAYFGSALASIRMDSPFFAMEMWKQAMRRFSDAGAGLDALQFNFKELASAPDEVIAVAPAIYAEVRTQLQLIKTSEVTGPRRDSLTAFLTYLEGDLSLAVERARTAAQADLKNDPADRTPGIELLFQRLQEAERARAEKPSARS